MNRIVIEVSKGMVVDAYYTETPAEIIIVDWDALEEVTIPEVMDSYPLSQAPPEVMDEVNKLSE